MFHRNPNENISGEGKRIGKRVKSVVLKEFISKQIKET